VIKIIQKESRLLLKYDPDFPREDTNWVDGNLTDKGYVQIVRVFTFQPTHILPDPNVPADETVSRIFVLGELDQQYFKIDKDILDLQFDLLIDKTMRINNKTFMATGNISVFRKIDHLVNEQIIIGGDRENAIPVTDFEKLLQNFPTKTTLEHFANSRISGILKDYLGTITDAEKKLNDHLKKLESVKSSDKFDILKEYEVRKYEFIRDRLVEMLKDSDAYSEGTWQLLKHCTSRIITQSRVNQPTVTLISRLLTPMGISTSSKLKSHSRAACSTPANIAITTPQKKSFQVQ